MLWCFTLLGFGLKFVDCIYKRVIKKEADRSKNSSVYLTAVLR
jgi:hypothetical protein